MSSSAAVAMPRATTTPCRWRAKSSTFSDFVTGRGLNSSCSSVAVSTGFSPVRGSGPQNGQIFAESSMSCRHAAHEMRELLISTESDVGGAVRCSRYAVLGGGAEAPLLRGGDQARRIAGDGACDVDVLHAAVSAYGEEETGRRITIHTDRRNGLIDGHRVRARAARLDRDDGCMRRAWCSAVGTARDRAGIRELEPVSLIRGLGAPRELGVIALRQGRGVVTRVRIRHRAGARRHWGGRDRLLCRGRAAAGRHEVDLCVLWGGFRAGSVDRRSRRLRFVRLPAVNECADDEHEDQQRGDAHDSEEPPVERKTWNGSGGIGLGGDHRFHARRWRLMLIPAAEGAGLGEAVDRAMAVDAWVSVAHQSLIFCNRRTSSFQKTTAPSAVTVNPCGATCFASSVLCVLSTP